MKAKKTQKPKADQKASLSKAQKKLVEQAEQLQKEKDELFAKLQRISADYANYQKRAPKQIADTVAYEKESIIKTFLAVLDNFEHTINGGQKADSPEVLLKGIQMVYDQLLDLLKSHGVEQIKALGEDFDPACHQAMMQESDPEKPDGAVLSEFQKGYRLNDRVIRPSKVVVNKQSAEQDNQAPEKE